MTEVRHYEVLSTCEHPTHLKPIFSIWNGVQQQYATTQRPHPFCLFVISNGRQEVHARTLTSAW